MKVSIYLILQCRDTYWVESCNHQLLTYLPIRIHFDTKTFQMRMNLAVMDWVSLPHVRVMGPVIYNQTFRMKTLNGWLLVIMNIWMFVDQTIIPRTVYWSRKHTALLRTSGVRRFSGTSCLKKYVTVSDAN